MDAVTANLGFQPQVKALTDDVKALIPVVGSKEKELEDLQMKLKIESQKFTPEKILEQMQARADAYDAESQDILDMYMSEDLDYFKISSKKRLFLEYKKAYIAKRKEYHEMMAKIGRFRFQYGMKGRAPY